MTNHSTAHSTKYRRYKDMNASVSESIPYYFSLTHPLREVEKGQRELFCLSVIEIL